MGEKVEITLQEKKDLLIKMQEKLIAYFSEHNISWFFAFGTLLGAIRHKGFIPWDDDIDILIPRRDYLRLLHLLENDTERLQQMNLEIVDYGNTYKAHHKRFKIADTRTTMEEYGKERLAVFIDIFPMDYCRKEKNVHRERKKIIALDNLLVLAHSGRIPAKGIKGFIYGIILFIFKLFGLKRIEQYLEKELLKISVFDIVGYTIFAESGGYLNLPAQWHSSYIEVPFETLQVRIPIGYHDVLTSVYGDYMTLPPEDKRYSHTYSMYWKDKTIDIEING